ncbi:MAG: hypothetical protein AB4290_29800 [Spirulina sp.]
MDNPKIGQYNRNRKGDCHGFEKSFSDSILKIRTLDLSSPEKPNHLAERIAIASIVLSIATAILFAILTSRAIVCPLRNLTRIARRSTQDSILNWS